MSLKSNKLYERLDTDKRLLCKTLIALRYSDFISAFRLFSLLYGEKKHNCDLNNFLGYSHFYMPKNVSNSCRHVNIQLS